MRQPSLRLADDRGRRFALPHRPDEAFGDPVPELDGSSPPMIRLKRDVLRVARDAHVSALILGESGTGKELVARAIHRLSPRAMLPFVVINCAGLSPTLAEDEIFGHVRGAFTGAVSDRPGPFERANGGTVFLDEVGDLTPDLQMKLLRALQERTVQRLGSGRETRFDLRVLAATNVDLARSKARGTFRQDLYYRLNVYELRIPPLRRRGAADLRQLVDSILTRLAAQRHRPSSVLAHDVWEILEGHSWPGNVRELENTLERMVVAAGDESPLRPQHLPDDFNARAERATPRIPSRRAPSAAEAMEALARNDFRRGPTAAELGLSRHQLYRILRRDVRGLPAGQEAVSSVDPERAAARAAHLRSSDNPR